MSQSNPIITGARAGIAIKNAQGQYVTAGYATGVTIMESTALARLDTLGFIDTRELEPIGRAVSVSCNFVRMKFNESEQVGTNTLLDESVVVSADSQIAGVNSTPESRTRAILDGFPEVDILVFDAGVDGDVSAANKLLYTVKGCRPSSFTVAVDRTSMMMANVMFDGLFLITHQTSAQ